MSTTTERPTLPKGWEWDRYGYWFRRLEFLVLIVDQSAIPGKWAWRVRSYEHFPITGTSDTASSAAAAAERAVVDWARGLIREVDGTPT